MIIIARMSPEQDLLIKTGENMDRISFISHRGHAILYADFSNSNPEEMIQNLHNLELILAKQPDRSTLVLENMTNIRFNEDVINAGKQLWTNYACKTKKIALIGIEGLKVIVRDEVSTAAQVDLPSFPTLEEAKDFLIQDEPKDVSLMYSEDPAKTEV